MITILRFLSLLALCIGFGFVASQVATLNAQQDSPCEVRWVHSDASGQECFYTDSIDIQRVIDLNASIVRDTATSTLEIN